MADPWLICLLKSSLSCHSTPRGTVSLLFDCSALLSARHGCSVLHSAALLLHSTRPARIPISICWLCLAVRVFTHTLSHAWCPVTLLSLTCCSTVVVTVAASCGRARDSVGAVGAVGAVVAVARCVVAVARCVVAVARCVVAARLPPSVISSTIQCCNAVQCTGAFKRWFLCHKVPR